jgi:hypothetical protein
MPKPMTHRRIDGRPQRAIRRFQAGAGASGGGGSTQEPTADITVVLEFQGSGDDGEFETFNVPGGLQNGDIYVAAFAAVGNGYLEFDPRDALGGTGGYGISTFNYGVSIAAWEVGAGGHGDTSFTVTVQDAPVAYYGWVLRGARSNVDGLGIIGDTAYFTITRPGGCGSGVPTVRGDPEPMPATVTPTQAGALGFYAAGGRADGCLGIIPTLFVTGATSSTVGSQPHPAGVIRYNFGTFEGPWEVDATITEAEDGNVCSAAVLVIYPAE